MTDPSDSTAATLMPTPDPYAPPRANLQAASVDRIARLDVADAWKDVFRLIEKAGGAKLPSFRDLPNKERRAIQSNWAAFFFGPFYFLAKGLWLPALVVFCSAIALGLALEAMGIGGAKLGIAFGFYCYMRANVLYYRLKVDGEQPWG
jgi:hypothetical protein